MSEQREGAMTQTEARQEPSQEELQDKLRETAERLGVPGVAIGIFDRGDERYAFTGVTSVDNPLPVDEETLFQIGSTTKTFTATALMRLQERGLVDLAAPVRTYVPELRLQEEDVARRVTVLQLLNHTAGWEGDFFHETGDGDDALAKYVEAMATLRQLQPLGGLASYNNAAVGLAGRVVEKVTGQTYEAAARELVLDPLGLEHSFFFPAEVMTRRFAVGHIEGEDGPRVAAPWRLPRSSTAAGALVSTAADQIRYARFHLGRGEAHDGEILRPQTRLAMQQPTGDFHGSAIADRVGVSWLLRRVGGVALVGHGGTTNGQLSAFQMVPDLDFAVTILTNATAGGRLHRELLAWVLEHYLGVREPAFALLELSEADLAAYAGTYRSDTVVATVTIETPGLRVATEPTEAARERYKVLLAEVPHDPPFPIRLLVDDGFVITDGKGEGVRGSFLRADGNGVTGINLGGRVALRV
ncbi:MAG: serine hydrolase domain-containing protein [Candidatus Dormiibacterota bacterium]